MPAFIASFTVSQSTDGVELTILDTSPYTIENKSTFSARRLYIYTADGNTMLADGSISTTTPATFIDFSFASYPSDTITIPLKVDWAFSIVLELVSTNPQAGSSYSAQTPAFLKNFIKLFLQSLTQGVQAQARLENDESYQMNYLRVAKEVKCIDNAQEFNVISSAQNAIDRAYIFINNQSYYF